MDVKFEKMDEKFGKIEVRLSQLEKDVTIIKTVLSMGQQNREFTYGFNRNEQRCPSESGAKSLDSK
jgi:hypothetical protein